MKTLFARRLLAAASALCLAASLGCGGSSNDSGAAATKPGAPKKGLLVVYSTHGKENVEPVLDRFRAANPDLDVEWRQFATVDLFNAVSAERDDPQCDVWWGGPHTTFMQAEKDGLLEKWVPSWADKVPADAKSPAGFWHGNYRMPECVMYNANVLSPDEAPKEWDDLVKPEWKGRIVLREPSKSGTMKAIFGAMIWRTYKATGNADEGFAWLAKLHDNVATYAPDPRAMYQALNTPETPVTVWNMVDAHVQSQQGFNFKAVLPKSGVPVLVEGIALVKDCPHPDAAKRFVEWVATPEQAVHQAKEFHRIPARTDIPADQLPEWMTANEIVAMEIDPAKYLPLEQPWMNRFRDEIQIK